MPLLLAEQPTDCLSTVQRQDVQLDVFTKTGPDWAAVSNYPDPAVIRFLI